MVFIGQFNSGFEALTVVISFGSQFIGKFSMAIMHINLNTILLSSDSLIGLLKIMTDSH